MDVGSEARGNLELDLISGAARTRELSEFLDRAFPVPEGSRFFDDFPVWDEQVGPKDVARLGIYQAQKLVSSVCVRIAALKSPGAPELRVAIIGAVASDPVWRGKGLASRMVEMAVEWARARDAAFAILWSSDEAFYKRLGFEPAGEQQRIPLSELKLPREPRADREARRGWQQGLMTKLENRPAGLVIRRSDLSWVGAHRNVDWFWSGDPASPDAYAAVGKGIDLQNLVHEWGGGIPALKDLLARVREACPGAALLGSPAIIEAHGLSEGNRDSEPMCLMRKLGAVGTSLPSLFWLWGLDGA